MPNTQRPITKCINEMDIPQKMVYNCLINTWKIINILIRQRNANQIYFEILSVRMAIKKTETDASQKLGEKWTLTYCWDLTPKPKNKTVIRSSYTNSWYISKVLKFSIPHIQVHCGTIRNIHFIELAQVCIKGWI